MNLIIRTRTGERHVIRNPDEQMLESFLSGFKETRGAGDIVRFSWNDSLGNVRRQVWLRWTEVESITEDYPEIDAIHRIPSV